jgi:hypothetical protein
MRRAVALALLVACDAPAPEPVADAAVDAAPLVEALPPASTAAPRVAVAAGEVSVDGKTVTRVAAGGGLADRGLVLALKAAASHAGLVEVALPDDAPAKQWTAIVEAAQQAGFERLAFVVPGDSIDIEIDTATVRARAALQLVYRAGGGATLQRWSYQDREGEARDAADVEGAVTAACAGASPCVERVVVHPPPAATLKELLAMVAAARRAIVLAGAYEPPIVVVGPVDDKSPLWAYRSLPAQLVDILVRSHQRDLDACHAEARDAEPGLEEVLMLAKLELDADGRVTRVVNDPKSDKPHVVALHACVAKVLETLAFPLLAEPARLNQALMIGRR